LSEPIEVCVSVPADHPSLPGHFPGQPVVPGVLLLERMLEAAEQEIGSQWLITGLSQVKFLAPLLPGETATATLEWTTASAIRFRIERAGRPIAQGALQIAAETGP